MVSQIFVNLHVGDLQKSIEFFKKLGFTFDDQFSDDSASCMIIASNINAMLLTRSRFQNYTPKELSDPITTTEVLTALQVANRGKVDSIADVALAAGGSEVRPREDHGFMYSRSFNDLDGHIWEIFWMDASAMPKS